MQFNHFAEFYNTNAFIQKDLVEWGLPWIDIIPITNTAIIEFGAGTGCLTKHLLKQNPSRIIATDISPNMISKGKRDVPQANWKLKNAWDDSPRSFNHIFSSSLLQWCPNPQQTILNWSRYLPNKGSIHVLFFIDQTLKELREFISLDKVIQWRTLESWTSFFRDAGLQVLLAREHVKTYNFHSALHLLKTLKYTGASLKNQVCGGRLREIIKKYDEQYYSTTGVFSTWQFCQLVVQK